MARCDVCGRYAKGSEPKGAFTCNCQTGSQMCCSDDVRRAVLPIIPARLLELQECFVVLCLDAKHKLTCATLTAIGSATSVEVHPRDVFRMAVRCNAVAIIVAHNHPSGDTEPSIADRQLTDRLRQAGDVLGIKLLDHVIVSKTGMTSLAARGLLL